MSLRLWESFSKVFFTQDLEAENTASVSARIPPLAEKSAPFVPAQKALVQFSAKPRATLFSGTAADRLEELLIPMLGNPDAATIKSFFENGLPEVAALLKNKPALMRQLAYFCERMPAPFGSLVGVACRANAGLGALAELEQVEPENETLVLAALKRIYPFNPVDVEALITRFGLMGSTANRMAVLDVLLTSRIGDKNAIGKILSGLGERTFRELDQISPTLISWTKRPTPADQNLASKQAWLTEYVKNLLGEPRYNDQLSTKVARLYDARFDPKQKA